MLNQLEPLEDSDHRLKTLYADAAFGGGLEQLVAPFSGWTLQIVQKPSDQKGFAVQPKRWIVERSLAWLGKYRRLSKDYEFRTDSSEAIIRWAWSCPDFVDREKSCLLE